MEVENRLEIPHNAEQRTAINPILTCIRSFIF